MAVMYIFGADFGEGSMFSPNHTFFFGDGEKLKKMGAVFVNREELFGVGEPAVIDGYRMYDVDENGYTETGKEVFCDVCRQDIRSMKLYGYESDPSDFGVCENCVVNMFRLLLRTTNVQKSPQDPP